uniref:Uncharacterized protein n=1 Tax=Sphaerodactylus townsendi TaxID=933632 RepID=A0ACB8FFF1_9SAUR
MVCMHTICCAVIKQFTVASSRSAFTARRDDPRNPNWLSVGLTLASTVAIWVLIFKQHNDDTIEYERRKAERESLSAGS